MKSIIVNIVSAASLVIATSALAVDMPPEGKAKCGTCHDVSIKKIGPSFMDVAAKYKGDKDATSKIAANINKGGAFGWNLGKMPPKGLGANDDLIKSMSEFIAGLAK